MHHHTSGFTLIELLIVTVIIGVLTAVLIPNLLSARNKANDMATQAYIRHCITAIEMQRDSTTGGLPSSLNGQPCTTNKLGSNALAAASAVFNSEITITANQTITVKATSRSGTTFRFDGAVTAILP